MATGLGAWYSPPPVIEADLFTILPSAFRKLGTSEHSRNQKRGKHIDSFLEGPCIVGDILYLTDIPYGRIFAVDLNTKEWTLIVEYDGEPNGLAWHPQKKQILIADFKQGILALDIDSRTLSTVMDRFNGERLKGPNDLIVAHDGSFIFTDQGMSGLQDPTGRLYRIQPDGRVDVLLRNCPSPNGLVLDPSQTTLLVAMTRDNSVWQAPLYPDGSVQRTGRFSSYGGMGGPDGLAVDEEGSLFVAHSTLGTIFVSNRDGTPKLRIDVGKYGKGTTNLTWKGQKLFVVESESGSVVVVDWHCKGLM